MKKQINLSLEIQKAIPMGSEEGYLVVEGYATTANVDSEGQRFTEKALKGAENDLLEYSTVLFNHDKDRPIGKVLETQYDDVGIWIKVAVSNTEMKIKEQIMDGTLSKFSIMGTVHNDDVKEVIDKSTGDKIIEFNKAKFYEVSLVSVPANSEAKAVEWYLKDIFNNKTMNVKKKLEEINKMDNKKEMLVTLKTFIKDLENDITKENETSNVSKSELIKTLESIIKSSDDESEVRNLVESLLLKMTNSKFEESVKVLGLSEESKSIFLVDDGAGGNLEDNKFRKQILKVGKWFHKDANGGVLEITKKSIDKLVENFKKGILENVFVPLGHSSDPTKNAGKVTELIPTEKGLDAVIEVIDKKVLKKIKDGLITNVSSSVIENYVTKDKGDKVGPVLGHVALVAEPYIKGLAKFMPVSLSDNYDVIELDDEPLTPKKAIKIITDVKEEKKDKEDKVEKKKEDVKEEDKKEEEVKDDVKEEKEDVKKEKKEDKEEKEDEKKEDKNDKQEAKEEKSSEEESKEKSENSDESKDKSDEEKESKADLSERERKVELSEAEKTYGELLEQGKIVPAQKETFITLYTAKGTAVNLSDEDINFKDQFMSFLKDMPKAIDFEEKTIKEKDDDPKKDLSEDGKHIIEHLDLSDDDAKEAAKNMKSVQSK